MKINLVFLLVFLECFYIPNSVAAIFTFPSLNIGIESLAIQSKPPLQKKSKTTAPFQGKKMFCSVDNRAKYIITITDDSVLIVIDNIKVRGVFEKDKLFTNDPREVEYRRFSHAYDGKYFVIGTDYFSILNSENGEYSYYTFCK